MLFVDLVAHLLRQNPWYHAGHLEMLTHFPCFSYSCGHAGVIIKASAWELLSTYLPSHPQLLQRSELLVAGFVKELSVNHRIQQPVPIFPRNVRNKPGIALAMEPDLLGQSALDQEVR